MTTNRQHLVGVLFALVATALVVVASGGVTAAQDVLIGNHRISGPTSPHTYTFPDADARVATATGASAWRIAAGTITLDGTNPSSATTGLTAIAQCTVTDKRSAAPGDELAMLTTITSAVAGRLDVYAWANTGGTDPTLAASSDADDLIDWICIGT